MQGVGVGLCESGVRMCVGVQQQPPPVNPLDRGGGSAQNPAKPRRRNAKVR
jgi:hypothetical protein